MRPRGGRPSMAASRFATPEPTAMPTFARPFLARAKAASLAIALVVSGCGGGDSAPGAAGDLAELSFDELAIPAGEERAFSAERVTIRNRFDVKGTLALSMPPGSTADRVILRLPPGAVIEGTISLRQVARAASAFDRQQAQATGVRPAAFVPRHVPALIIEGGIPGQPLYVYSTARLETPAGDDAPEEVLADLGLLRPTSTYDAARGGDGGDIHILSNGVVVLRFPLGVAADTDFQPFAPGNGGKGADLTFNDGTWNDAGLLKASIRAGAGGDSGRLFIDANEIRLQDERVGGNAFVIGAPHGSGVGGAGGKLTWDVVRPDLRSLEKIELSGGGGGGMGEGGPGGVARFAAGKPIAPATAPRPVGVVVEGGHGGAGGEDRLALPMVTLSPTLAGRQPVVKAFGGKGGSVTAVGHTGAPGTAAHPDGYEPGPLDVRFGWGGDVSVEPLFVGRAGNGAGMQAGVTLMRGGDGGDGYSSCGDPDATVGGAGGRSGHVSVRAGLGGSGPSGGDAGALFYDGVDPGRPGRGGMGLAGGPAGFYGQPDRGPLEPPIVAEVRDDPGLRLEGMVGGESRDGRVTFSSSVQGAFVLPIRTPGDACGVVPVAGRILLPAASYHGRFYSGAFPGAVSELFVTTSADCIFLDTRPGFLGAGYADPTQACVTVHEVTRFPSDLDPRGYSESIIDRVGSVIEVFPNARAAQFLLRESFCSVDGVLLRPGSVSLFEAFPPYDSNGDPAPGPTLFQDHAADVAPIYPSEVEQTKSYCCKVKNMYPNGRVNGYDVGLLTGGVCR